MRNKSIVVAAIVFFGSIAIYFYTCNNEPEQRDPYHFLINYYYDFTHASFRDTAEINRNLNTTVSILNNLCRKLELKHKFEISKFINLKNEHFEPLRIDRYQNDIFSDTISIFLDGYGNDGDRLYYARKGDFIYIPFPDRYSVVALLHEIVHKISPEIIHVSNDNPGFGAMQIVRSSACLNLMYNEIQAPFKFFLYGFQHDQLHSKENSTIPYTHEYPADLVKDNFESLFTCDCPLDISLWDFDFSLNKSITQDQFQAILEFVDVNNVCPLKMTIGDTLKIDDIITATERINYASDTLRFQHQIVIFNNNLMDKELLGITSYIVKLKYIFNKKIIELFRDEAEYLASGLEDVDSKEFFEYNYRRFILHILHQQIVFDEFTDTDYGLRKLNQIKSMAFEDIINPRDSMQLFYPAD